jgi:flagella basal body P-ring formation protein FlgA
MKIFLIIILFVTNLFSFEAEDRLENYIYKKFVSYYPTMSVKKVTIKLNSTIPKGYKLDRVYFQKNSLKRDSGNFSAIYSDGVHEKRVYLKYNIKATVPVLVAIDDIPSHTSLDSSYFMTTSIKFTNFYDKPILKVEGYESKTFIPKGKILVSRLVRGIPAIHRGDIVQAVAKDGGIELSFLAKALQDGIVGESIRVKRDGYKILKAKVISSGLVEIK